jgi:F-type H+-transporting ATPase subunit epsilon
MHVIVLSPERAAYDGDAEAVVAPAFDGQVGILPRHAPFVTLLGKGPLTIRAGGADTRFHLTGGFLQVAGDAVRVVAEQVESR